MPKKKEQKSNLPPEPAINSKLFSSFRRIIEQLIHSRNYHPLSLSELMEKFQLPPQHTDTFNAALNSHIADGLLKLDRGRYILKKQGALTFTGIIRVHFRGFGFVKVDDPSPYEEDVFIPKHLTMNAVDGDHVEIIVNPEISEKGPEGKISAVLSRSRTHVAGTIISSSNTGDIEAYVPLFGLNRRVVVTPNAKFALKKGDRVVMKVLDWGSRDSETSCEVSHYLGHISDPSCDIDAAIEEFGLRSTFSTKAIKEAKVFGTQVPRSEILEREDIRDQECVTIDPDTAKDFDDAITLRRDRKRHYHLGVHIADVSHYVKEGSALDIEARKRCNSTYFPGTCLPMLPPMLSENLCSLKAGVNRLTVSVFMHFDPKGHLLDYRISKTVIRSAKRLSYREAKEILDGTKKSKHLPLLKLMVELCKVLKTQRYERGSIEFSLPELIVKIDEKGVPVGTDYVAYDVTHQMIEEFMLKANEIVATHLTKEGKGVAYRIHDEPSDDNMKDFCMLANAFGFKLRENASAQELQELFEEALQTPFGQYLATSYIRCMRQALYSPENIGHYGLGLSHYCHFTSPIRRYVDLVIHRALYDDTANSEKLETITRECSEQERISAKAESSVLLLKKLRLMDRLQKEDPTRQYTAVVTRVKQFGFSFEVLDFLLEGFFHVADLDGDYYIYEEAGRRLRGRHRNAVFHAGENITVMLKEVDFLRLDSKWHLVSGGEQSTSGTSTKHRKGKEGHKNTERQKGKGHRQKANPQHKPSKKPPLKAGPRKRK
jgi:ribonuclease R